MDNKEKFNLISSLVAGLIPSFIGILFGKDMAFFGFVITVLLWALSYRYLIILPKQKKQQEKGSHFFIKGYFSPNYGQAKEIGIFVQNVDKDEEDVFPKIRIIGDITREEYENGILKTLRPLLPPADNRIFSSEYEKIEFNLPQNIILAKIDKKNIFIPLEKNFLLESFWEINDENYEFTRKRWSFVFEIFGKKGNSRIKFESERYSIYFEAYERHNDVFLEFGEVKKVFE